MLREEYVDYCELHSGDEIFRKFADRAPGDPAKRFDEFNSAQANASRSVLYPGPFGPLLDRYEVKIIYLPVPWITIHIRRIYDMKIIVIGQGLPWLAELSGEIDVYKYMIKYIDLPDDIKNDLEDGFSGVADAIFRGRMSKPDVAMLPSERDSALRHATSIRFRPVMQFLLLHELGHFHHDHDIASIPTTDFASGDLRPDLWDREHQADQFATAVFEMGQTPSMYLDVLSFLHRITSFECINGYSADSHPPTYDRLRFIKFVMKHSDVDAVRSIGRIFPDGYHPKLYSAEDKSKTRESLYRDSLNVHDNSLDYSRWRDFIGEYSQKGSVVPDWKLEALLGS